MNLIPLTMITMHMSLGININKHVHCYLPYILYSVPVQQNDANRYLIIWSWTIAIMIVYVLLM